MQVKDIEISELLGRDSGLYKAFYQTATHSARKAYFTVYAPDSWRTDWNEPISICRNRPCVILCPGGGYHFTFEGEGEPVALKFCAAGCCVFELRYSCTEANGENATPLFPQPLEEILAVIYYARTHAAEYGIDPHNISVMGFSAGGHVASMGGTLWNKPVSAPFRHDDVKMYRPDKMILCYPVILSGKNAHQDSIARLMGKQATNEMLAIANTASQIDADTPPAYIWHCEDDACVPIENSHAVENALRSYGTYCECHYFPRGGHGCSLGTYLNSDDTEIGHDRPLSVWIDEAIAFVFKKDL